MFSFSMKTTTATATATLSTTTSAVATTRTATTTTAMVAAASATAPPSPSVANSIKMPQAGGCMVALPSQPSTVSYNFEQLQQQHQQQQHFSITTTETEISNDAYETYADNFDLSLLPQEYSNATANIIPANIIENIPTTVFNFNETTTSQQQQEQQQTTVNKVTNLSVPDIKVEQTWSSCPSLHTIKTEETYHSYFPTNAKENQLIPPPPAYPAHIYPSPQSSPAQSEYNLTHAYYSSGCYESLSSSRNSLYNATSSPCPSIDAHMIKQEQLHILPPSPPESNCDTPTPLSGSSCCSSGFDFKSETFDSDLETFHDLKKSQTNDKATMAVSSGHQLLREYLEDSTFQKIHNLKPLALESFIGGLEEVRDNIEPVISLALEYAKREADATCAKLQISQDPSVWSADQVHAWLRSTLQQFELPEINGIENRFNENGAKLLQLTEEEFTKRIPECGSILHAQLEIWKLTYSPECLKNTNLNQTQQSQNSWMTNALPGYDNSMEEESEDEEGFPKQKTTTTTSTSMQSTHNQTNGRIINNDQIIATNTISERSESGVIADVKRTGSRSGGSHIHLWQFLKELLAAPHINGTAIRWIDRSKGIFKIEDSVRVAKLWGKRKNRPAMNYDKLSRSIRQYYKKGIMKKTERSQRLVYQFCQPYHM